MLKPVRSTDVRDVHARNILAKLVTLEVLKPVRSTDVSDEQEENILAKLVTREVLIVPVLNVVILEHPSNAL